MKHTFVLFLALLCFSCKHYQVVPNSQISTQPTGKLYTNAFVNSDLKFKSVNHSDSRSKLSAAGLRKCRLRKDFKNYILHTSDSCQILFSSVQDIGNCYYLVKLYSTDKFVLQLENEIKQELQTFVSQTHTKYYQLQNGKNMVWLRYGLLKNKKTVFEVNDYLVQWSPNAVIRLTQITPNQGLGYVGSQGWSHINSLFQMYQP